MQVVKIENDQEAQRSQSYLIVACNDRIEEGHELTNRALHHGHGNSTKGAPTKNCPKCGNKNHAAKRSCDKCGYAFAVKKKKRRRRKKKAAAAPAAVSDRVSMSSLVAAKKLADQLGGVQKAQDALRALSRLS